MKQLGLVLCVFLLLVIASRAYEPLYVPPVGPIKCVDPSGCGEPAYTYPSSDSSSSSSGSSLVSSGSGISLSLDHPCVQAAANYCYQICKAYTEPIPLKSCMVKCIRDNPNTRRVFIKCAQIYSSTPTITVAQAQSPFRRPLAQKPVTVAPQSAKKPTIPPVISRPVQPAGVPPPEPEKHRAETKTEPEEKMEFTVLVGDASVTAGSTVSIPVKVKLVKGKPKQVTLTIGGSGIFDLVQNSRASYSFSSLSVIPTNSVTLTIQTTKNSVPGSYPLAVRGLGENKRISGEFTLTILL